MAGLPDKIGTFEVIRQIGAGGMGAVYLGRDAELNRQVAIKVIKQEVHDQEVLDRFFREARAAAALRHPNIITIYASGQHEHQPYMVLEFVDGDSLVDIVRERRQLPLSEKLSYLDQICAGLHFAHRAGIVHRDIKPANVMVDREGVVRILDFGIARIEGSAMTQDGTLIGSLNYMSPEQMLGRAVDHRSDIFSVGSLAYELLTYQQAFKGNLNDGLFNRLPNEDPPLPSEVNPEIPPDVEEVIMRALKKAPDDRFQNLADMRAALGVVKAGSLPLPEERTIVIRRGDAPSSKPKSSNLEEELFGQTDYGGAYQSVYDFKAPTTPPSQWEPPSQVAASPPAPAEMSAPAAPDETPASPAVDAPAVESKPAAPAPPSPATVIAPPSTVIRKSPPTTITPPSTITKAPSTSTRPPTVASRPLPPPPVQQSSKKWIVIAAVAVAVIGGTIVAVPRFMEQPDPAVRERPRVVETMERFRTAYRTKNLTGMAAVFPSLPQDLRQGMQRAFANCLLYEVAFAGMQVDLNPDATQAQVDVRSTHQCTPNSNERQSTTVREDAFTLQRQGDDWTIASMAEKGAKPVQ